MLSTALTFVGGLIRALSTAEFIAPFDEDETEPLEMQYWLAFIAQVMIGMANPMVASLPTAVSFDAHLVFL